MISKKLSMIGKSIRSLAFALVAAIGVAVFYFNSSSVVSAEGYDIVGKMTSAEGVTAERIAKLPAAERRAWTQYLNRSDDLRELDKRVLAAERKSLASIPPNPKHGSVSSMPLNKPDEWYGSKEARAIADNIVSYQTPAGGWGKNQDRTAPPRVPGEFFVEIEDLPAFAQGDIDGDPKWRYVGTIDNGATLTELRFLSRVQHRFPGAEGDGYRKTFLKGIQYLLSAQYPNGGWPQIYPLQGGYHDAITFNDDAIGLSVELLEDVAARSGDLAFVPRELAEDAKNASRKGLAVILKTQVVINGKRTLWGQQHDAFTLEPAGARSFEPAALSTGESADLLLLLMRQPDPTPEMTSAIRDGIEWLRAHTIYGFEWKRNGELGRQLVAKEGAGPLWARFYDLKTFKPIFGDRDRNIRDNVNEVTLERRNGYSWFNTAPAKAVEAYEKQTRNK